MNEEQFLPGWWIPLLFVAAVLMVGSGCFGCFRFLMWLF